MSNDNRSISELRELSASNFFPDDDMLIYSQAPENEEDQYKTKLIPFNTLMDGGREFSFKGDLFKWNLVQNGEIKAVHRLTPPRFQTDDGSGNQIFNGYYYFDVKIAGLIDDEGREIIPHNATYVLMTMEHKELEISDIRGTINEDLIFNSDDTVRLDAYGWTKFEETRKNFVFENMQYPVNRVVALDDLTDIYSFIPDSKEHPNMNAENHIGFRCPEIYKDNQVLRIYAWSY